MATGSAVRQVLKVVKGQPTMEGGGVKVIRSMGNSQLQNLDPFLLLDELKHSAAEMKIFPAAGFHTHPHRGFSTLSVLLKGAIQHKDSAGNQGVVSDGGVQWMTAGRGVVHSEMPLEGEVPGDGHGFQLWINLPAKDKMGEPRYQDIQAEAIPVVNNNTGATVRVLSGTCLDVAGPIDIRWPGLILDASLSAGGTFQCPMPSDWACFAYVYEGSGLICGKSTQLSHVMILGDGDSVEASSDAGMKFMLVSGKPIGEPIVAHGPFVMNTHE